MPAPREVASLVTGAGTGRLSAAGDPSATPLGDRATWTPALRTALGIVLGSPQPLLLWWGPELTLLPNEAFTALTGHRHAGAPGARGEAVFAEDWPAVRAMLHQVLDGAAPAVLADRLLLVDRDGTPQEAYWTYASSPVRDEDGHVAGVFTTVVETTALVRARRETAPAVDAGPDHPWGTEDALTPEQERYRTLVAQVPVGIWATDAAGATIYVNDHLAELVGRPTTDLLGSTWAEHVPPDDLAATAASWAAAVRDGALWEHGHRLAGRDGSIHHVVSSARPLRGADGAVTGFLGTTVDLTEQRRTERARRDTAAELAARRVADAASARLQAMVQGLAAIVWEADWEPATRTLRFTFVSDRAEELLGHPTRRWYHEPGFWAAVIHPDDRERVAALIGDRTAAGLDHDATFRALSVDGRAVWLHQVVHVVCDPEGAPLRAQGLTVDVTEQKRAERSAEVLAETGRLVTESGTAEQRLAALADLVVHDLGDGVVVSLIGPDGLVRRVAVAHADPDVQRALIGLAPSRLPPSLVEALAPGRPIVVPVTEELSRQAARDDDDADARARLGATGVLVVPLTIDGEVVGMLGFLAFGPRQYDVADLDLAEELGRRASLMLAADRQRTRDRHMQQVSADLASAGSVAEAARRLVDRLGTVLGATAVSVYRVEPERGIRMVHGAGYSDALLTGYSTVRFDEEVPLAQVARTGEPVWVRSREDWRARWPELLPHAVAAGRHAAATIPLIAAGRVVGTIGMSFPTERTFPADERAFVMALMTQAAPAFERAATADERRVIAETLQNSLLPAALPELDRLALAARYLPGAHGTRAGGDWYDVLSLDEGRIAIAVGDVVGQGARAAAIMGQLRSALSAYLIEGHRPAPALELLDRFAGRVPGAAGSTVACLVLAPDTGEIDWASAGHLPPLVTGPAGARFLGGAGGTVLAVRGRPPFVAGRARIDPGDSIVLFTDGLVERRGEVVDDGLARLAAAASRDHALAPHALTGTLVVAAEGAGSSDDIALIVARLVPPPLRLELPGAPRELRRLRAALLAWATAAGLGADEGYDLQLAVGEAAANAVEHAYRDREPGVLAVEVVRGSGGTIQVCVADDGHWRPAPADRGYRGRGLDLIRTVSTSMELDHGPGGTAVRFVLPGARAATAAVPVPPAPPRPVGPVVVHRANVHGTARLAVRGDLDLAGVDWVRAELLAAVREAGGDVLIDLRATTYLASAGVALLVQALRAAPPGRLRLLATPGGIVRRALALSEVDVVVEVLDGPPDD